MSSLRPPRVEYALTPFGAKFVRVLDDPEKPQEELNGETARAAPPDLRAAQS